MASDSGNKASADFEKANLVPTLKKLVNALKNGGLVTSRLDVHSSFAYHLSRGCIHQMQ
jgi:parvulin-like peptidyl-prolyl isomerase